MRKFRSIIGSNNANLYVGPFGEIVVDNQLKVRIQDNVTPGGITLTADTGNIVLTENSIKNKYGNGIDIFPTDGNVMLHLPSNQDAAAGDYITFDIPDHSGVNFKTGHGNLTILVDYDNRGNVAIQKSGSDALTIGGINTNLVFEQGDSGMTFQTIAGLTSHTIVIDPFGSLIFPEAGQINQYDMQLSLSGKTGQGSNQSGSNILVTGGSGDTNLPGGWAMMLGGHGGNNATDGGYVLIAGGSPGANEGNHTVGAGGYTWISGGNGGLTHNGTAITDIILIVPARVQIPSHNLTTGRKIFIINIDGTTELNNQSYYVGYDDPNWIRLYYDKALTQPVDATGYSPYIAGGAVYSSSTGSPLYLYGGIPAISSAFGEVGSIYIGGTVSSDPSQPPILTLQPDPFNTNNTFAFDSTGNLNLPNGGVLGFEYGTTTLLDTVNNGVAIAATFGNAVVVSGSVGPVIYSNNNTWEYLGNAAVVGASVNNTQQQVQGTTTKVAGDPFPSYVYNSANATIWTASSDDIVGADLIVRAHSGDLSGVTELSRVTIAKEWINLAATPFITVYGQVTSNTLVSFTAYDASLDGSNRITLIANTIPHGSSRYFTYSATEFKRTYD